MAIIAGDDCAAVTDRGGQDHDNDPSFWSDLFETILQGAGETLYTVGFSLLFTIIFGLAAGVLLGDHRSRRAPG